MINKIVNALSLINYAANQHNKTSYFNFQKHCWHLTKIVSSMLKSGSGEFHTSSRFLK